MNLVTNVISDILDESRRYLNNGETVTNPYGVAN
ncbi:hypothetical protein L914_08884, partial [Phytophthora nicotianae]